MNRLRIVDVVVCEGAAVLELRALKDQALLAEVDAALLRLDPAFELVDGEVQFNIDCDGLVCRGLDENLHVPQMDANSKQLVLYSRMQLI